MGDETTRFASRFASALDLIAKVATDAGHAAARRRLGPPALLAAVEDALDAVTEVYETETEAVRSWGARRTQVLAQIAAVRAALRRDGLDAAARHEAGALVELVRGE